MTQQHDGFNPDLIGRIPLNARTVLDVGCGNGALGAEYKRLNPRARVLGIEADPELARIAATRMDAVAAVDVERAPLPFGRDQVDCIVYGDILEHTVDPWTLLARHAELLAEDGTMIACVPNLEHWSFTERLLTGNWDYEATGLLDRQHLRWFTWETMKGALEQAGMMPVDVTPRIFDHGRFQAFAHAIKPTLAALGIDERQYVLRAAPLQFVWRACKRRKPRLSVLATMLPPVGGVSHVRVLEPLRAMSSDCTVSVAVTAPEMADIPPNLTGEPCVFVLHRPILVGAGGLDLLRRIIVSGYVAVCEFDDHPNYLDALQQPDMHSFRGVHAVQTSTEPLAKVLSQHNPEVKVFSNATARLPDVDNFKDPGRITMFFGGLNRQLDWPPYIDAMNAVAEVAGSRLFFRIVADRGLFDALATSNKEFLPLCDYETYRDALSRSEISFMPLRDTPFNRCKSDLKFIEAAAHRVVALASDIVYAASVEDGQTGFVFRTPQEMQQRLMRVIADPAAGRRIGDAARTKVTQERMLAYQTAPRISWYRSLWDRREALHAALLARLPELGPLPAPGQVAQ